MNYLRAFTKEYACFSMISYLSGESLHVLLKYTMGFSKFFSSFCNKTPTMVCSEAKENKIKSFAKSGLASTGALVSSTLIYSNDYLALGVHFISLPFLSIFVMCFIISAKFGMNLLRKFTFPRKDFTSFLLLGVPIFRIPSTLLLDY